MEIKNYSKNIIFYLFVIFEALSFKIDNPYFTLLVTSFFYLWVIYFVLKKTESGLIYFISFSLLSLNMSNFLGLEGDLPFSFYGARLFNISLNFWVLIIIAFFLILKNKEKYKIRLKPIEYYLIIFCIYCIVIGLVSVVSNENYFDNFMKDFTTYFVIFPYIIIFKNINYHKLIDLLPHLVFSSFLLFIVSFSLGAYRQYAVGEDLLLINTFSSALIFALFFIKDRIKSWHFYFLALVYFYFVSQNLIILGGKTFVFFFLYILWLFRYRLSVFKLLLFGLIMISIPFILAYIRSYYGEGAAIANKVGQIQLIYQITNLEIIALHRSSIGNIAGEFLTMVDFFSKNPIKLLFGGGFGAAIPDSLGYLSWWAGNYGYAEIDFVRNSYHKMHLSFYEFILKGGVLFIMPYIYFVIKAFFSKTNWSFLFFIFFLLMFSVSKEFILLSLLFYYLGIKKSTNE